MLRTGTTLATTIGAAVLALVALVGEGAGDGDLGGGKALLVRVASTSGAAGAQAEGRSVRVGDRAVTFPAAVRDVAATDGGLYVLCGQRLWVTDLQVTLRTGVSGIRSLVSSPDGRYLAFVDHTTEHTRAEGGDLAAVAVYDTTTGERVVHTAAAPGGSVAGVTDDGVPILSGR